MTAHILSMSDSREANGKRDRQPGEPDGEVSAVSDSAVVHATFSQRPRRDSAPERLAHRPRPAEQGGRRPGLAAILGALERLEAGERLDKLAAELGVIPRLLLSWREHYQGVRPSDASRLEVLERENERLKKLVAELRLDKYMLEKLLRE